MLLHLLLRLALLLLLHVTLLQQEWQCVSVVQRLRLPLAICSATCDTPTPKLCLSIPKLSAHRVKWFFCFPAGTALQQQKMLLLLLLLLGLLVLLLPSLLRVSYL